MLSLQIFKCTLSLRCPAFSLYYLFLHFILHSNTFCDRHERVNLSVGCSSRFALWVAQADGITWKRSMALSKRGSPLKSIPVERFIFTNIMKHSKFILFMLYCKIMRESRAYYKGCFMSISQTVVSYSLFVFNSMTYFFNKWIYS